MGGLDEGGLLLEAVQDPLSLSLSLCGGSSRLSPTLFHTSKAVTPIAPPQEGEEEEAANASLLCVSFFFFFCGPPSPSAAICRVVRRELISQLSARKRMSNKDGVQRHVLTQPA